MTDLPLEIHAPFELRAKAAGRLAGRTDMAGMVAQAADALAVLHALASSPETAADALALLHEMQVHQVELEIQTEELRESGAALEAALRRQAEILDYLPVGFFALDRDMVVRDVNLLGSCMLGRVREQVLGKSLLVILGAEAFRAVQDLIAQPSGLADGVAPLKLVQASGDSLSVIAQAGLDPEGGFLLVLTPPPARPSP